MRLKPTPGCNAKKEEQVINISMFFHTLTITNIASVQITETVYGQI
jgi:hypothetical protein